MRPSLVPPPSLPHIEPPQVQRRARFSVASILVLARWQLRQTWSLLLIVGVGLLAAVVLVCAIPLYAQSAMSAGLQHTLEAEAGNAYLTVHAVSGLVAPQQIQSIQQSLTDDITGALGQVIINKPVFSIQISALSYPPNLSALVHLVGIDINTVKSHARLLQGRLPVATTGNTIELAMTPDVEANMGLKPGMTFTLPYTIVNPMLHRQIEVPLHFRLVGLIAPPDTEPFWHGETLQKDAYFIGHREYTIDPVLASNSQLLNVLTGISQQFSENFGQQSVVFTNRSPAPDLYWYYDFNFSHLDINHLDDLSRSLSGLLTVFANNPISPPFVTDTNASGPLDILQSYSSRISVLQVPVLCLTALISALILFFVLLMTGLLVERQVEAITLLRSRGGSRRQVGGSLLGQSTILCLIALLAGPPLAILFVIGLINLTIPVTERGALSIVTSQPLQTIQGVLGRGLLVMGVGLVVMALTIWRTMRSNILVYRGEAARSTQKPVWIRFNLDLLAAVIALVGFGTSIYLDGPGVLDIRTRTLILPLTSLGELLFLILGCLLLFLRLFPTFLRWGEKIAARNRGAAPLLALAQMARAPRQSLRMTLLFALAVAFVLFALIFRATQIQRLQDLTTYQVGSDFRGLIPPDLVDEDWNSQLEFYQKIRGITSVTMGDTALLTSGSNAIAIDLQAVDSGTYAQTTDWTEQDTGNQAIGALMARLHRFHTEADQKNVIPAIIDDAAAQSLNVHVGQQFTLADFHGPMNYMVTAIVHYIPTIYDTTSGTGSDTTIPQGGVLVDFQTYSDVAMAVNENGISASIVWLRANNNPADLAAARNVLFTGPYALVDGLDQRMQVQTLATDPLYAVMIGILAIGAIVALLLGLVGNILVAWLNARERRTSFAVLRALGCEPRQIASVLLWEQGIVYTTALVVGTVLSLLFSQVILPVFIFSPLLGSASTETFYIVQSVPAVREVVPVWSLVGVFIGLIGICILALLVMLRVVIRPSIEATLRVNED